MQDETEKIIKELHLILKNSISDYRKEEKTLNDILDYFRIEQKLRN